jgi:hypothetical protein
LLGRGGGAELGGLFLVDACGERMHKSSGLDEVPE